MASTSGLYVQRERERERERERQRQRQRQRERDRERQRDIRMYAVWTNAIIAMNSSTSFLNHHLQTSPNVPKTWVIKVLYSTRTFMKLEHLCVSYPGL
jgi:transcriptional antiterminator